MSKGTSHNANQLPSGWESVTLKELLIGIEAGKSFTCVPRPATTAEWGVIKVSAMTWGTFDADENKAVPRGKEFNPLNEIHEGDILLSRSNTAELVGATVLVGASRSRLLLSDKSMRLLYPKVLSARWLQRVLAAPQTRSQMSSMATGTSDSMRNISQENVYSIQLKLPPRNEQERIADALDELISDLDAGVAALQSAQAKLALYRASVLKAAVQGDLTAEWREQHPNAEPASALLQRILIERRQRWEQDQLRKFKASGKTPPANWKAKYKAPVAPETANLPQLPKGWCWATCDQLAWTSGYGTSVKCSESYSGIPVLRIPNISGGVIELTKIKFAPEDYSEPPAEMVSLGDLLIVRTNGSRSLIGRGAIAFEKPARDYSFASYLIRLRLVPDQSLLAWVSLVWQSATVRTWIERKAATSAGQYNISLGVLQTLAIPIPPSSEQEAITNVLEEQFTVEDHVQSDLATRFLTASSLRQSILRHAFIGQLVRQHPTDEPASELLKRIATEREERSKTKASSRKRATRRKSK